MFEQTIINLCKQNPIMGSFALVFSIHQLFWIIEKIGKKQDHTMADDFKQALAIGCIFNLARMSKECF